MYDLNDTLIKQLYRRFKKGVKYDDLIGKPSNVGNADTVDGFHASQECISNGIVVRDDNGYMHIGTPKDEEETPDQILITNSTDNCIRRASYLSIKEQMGIGTVRIQNSIFVVGRYTTSTGYQRIVRFSVANWTGGISYFNVFHRGNICRKFLLQFIDGGGDLDIQTFSMTPSFYNEGSGNRNGILYLVKVGYNMWEMYLYSGLNDSFAIWGFTPFNSLNGFEFDTKELHIISSLYRTLFDNFK